MKDLDGCGRKSKTIQNSRTAQYPKAFNDISRGYHHASAGMLVEPILLHRMKMRITAFPDLAKCVREEMGTALMVVGGVAIRAQHDRDAM